MVDDSLINRRVGGGGGGVLSGYGQKLFRSEETLGQFLKVHT